MAVTLNAKGTSVSSFTIGKGGQAITLNANGYLTIDDGVDTEQPIGYNTIPIYEIDANDTFDLAHAGMMWHKDSGGAVTFTCDNDSTIPQGSTWIVHNDDAEDITIAQGTGVTIAFLASGAAPTTGDVTVSQGGIVTVYKYTDTEYWVWGDDGPFNILTAGSTTDSTLRWNGSAWAENTTVTITSTGVVTASSTAGNHTFSVDSATTNADIPVLKLSATSTGTPAAGIGPSIQFESETAAGAPGNLEIGGEIALEATDVTATTEDFDFVFNTMAAGAAAAERFRISSTGSSFTTDLSLTGTTHLVLPSTNDAVTPTLAFGDADSGFYEQGDDAIQVAIAGSALWRLDVSAISFAGGSRAAMLVEVPSATNPVLVPNYSDTDTGIGHNAADQLSLVAGGVELIRATETGTATTDQVTIAPGVTLRGAAATPSLAFGDGDTGFYEVSDDLLGISFGGTSNWRWADNRIESLTAGGAYIKRTAYTTTNPVFSFASDTDTGVGGNTDQLSLIAGGVEIMRLVEDTEDYILSNTPILIAESAAAVADTAAYGQIWVKNDAPNTLMFTDDTGVDQVVITSDNIVGDLKNCASGTATLSTTADDYVELFSVSRSNGAHSFVLHTVMSDSGFSVAKTYLVTAGYNGTGGTAVYEVMIPDSDSGVYSGNDYRVEIDVTTQVATVRAVRTSGANGSTLDWEIWAADDSSAALTITPLSGTGTSAVTAIYNPHRIADIKGTDYADFTHDGTDFNTSFVNTTDWNINDGVVFKIWDSTDTDNAAFSHDGTNFNTTFTSTSRWDIGDIDEVRITDNAQATLSVVGGTNARIYMQDEAATVNEREYALQVDGSNFTLWANDDARSSFNRVFQVQRTAAVPDSFDLHTTLRMYDGGATDYVDVSHDGTDLNVAGTNTTDINITSGITAVNLPEITLTTALDETYGGTGQTTLTTGDLLYASGANTFSKLALGNVGEVLTVVGTNVAWSPPAVIEFAYDSTVTAADPGAGTIRFDSVTIGSIANAYIDDLDASGDNAEWILSNLADGDILTFRSITDPLDYIIASVNGSTTDGTGYWTVPLTLIHTGTIFTNGDQMRVSVEWAGSNASVSGFISGTVANNQIVTGTGASTVDSSANLTYDGTTLTMAGAGAQLLLPIENDAVTPTLGFGDGDTGFYENSDDIFRLAIGGSALYQFDGTHITGTTSASFYLRNTTVSDVNPSLGPRRDTNTGIGSAANDSMSLIAGGTEHMRFDATVGGQDHIKAEVPFYMDERVAALNDYANYGQLWVRNDAPNTLMYTDDAGNDFTANNVFEIAYVYSSAVTSTDPGAGTLNFNSVTIGSITTVYIDDLDDTGRDNSYMLSTLADGDLLEFRSASDPADYIVATVNGAPTDSTGFWTISLTLVNTGTIFTNNDQIRIIPTFLSQSPGLQNIVEDTTPQLGGSLDTNDYDINWKDGNFATFGTGSDVTLQWDNTDFEVRSAVGSSVWNFRDGLHIKLWDDADTNSLQIDHDGTDVNFTHPDGTTTSWNISGITDIAAGTVDADFDAITATSYGGITEANLLDKSAAETVTGLWRFEIDSATTNADIPVLQLSATSTGTPAAGIGPSIEFIAETAAGAPGNQETGGLIALEATDVTATSEDFDFVFNTMAAGAAAAERMRISSTGTVTATTFSGNLTMDSVALTAIQTSGEGFADNDTSIMTSAAIDDRILSYGYSTTTGTVTSSGTPLNNEVAVFTSGTDIDSDSTFTWDGTTMFATNVTGTNIGGIAQANLLDKSATETVSGEYTFSANPIIEQAVPRLYLRDTDATADEGNWFISGANDTFQIATASDAAPTSAVENAITINRAGTAVSNVTINNGDLVLNENLSFDAVTNTIAGIQNQNLLDKTAAETISGVYTHSAGIVITDTTEALALRAGDTSAVFAGDQITFGFDGNNQYQHAIGTRHNSAADANNAIDFYLWDFGTDTTNVVGTFRALTLDQTGSSFFTDLDISGALTLGTALDEAEGGTGQTTYATGDILYASASNVLSKLAAGTNTHVLTLSGGVPTWAAAPGATPPTTITVANEATDTTCFPLFVTAATGDLGPKTNANLTFNSATGHFTATSKSFLIKHPTKEGKKLQYGSLEGPEHGVYVRGRLTDNDTIELPDYWTALVDPNSITVNLTPVGAHQELYVADISDNKVIVGGSTDHMDFFYTVYAERNDIDRIELEIDDEGA